MYLSISTPERAGHERLKLQKGCVPPQSLLPDTTPCETSVSPTWLVRIAFRHSDPRNRHTSSTSHHPSHQVKCHFSIQGLCWATTSPWSLLTSLPSTSNHFIILEISVQDGASLKRPDAQPEILPWVPPPQPARCQARWSSFVLHGTQWFLV